MKRDYTALAAVVILIVCAIIVYFGRLYFPENFHPETVSFFENYWVLTFGLCFVVGLISICILGLWWIGNELVKDINSIDYETDEDFYDALKENHRQETEDNESIAAFVRLLAWVLFLIMGSAVVLLLIF